MWQYNDIYNTRQDELAHFGVQGMKWGVRKAGKIAKALLTNTTYSVKDKNINKRFDKVASKPRLQKKEAATASKIYKKQAKKLEKEGRVYEKSASKLSKRGDKYKARNKDNKALKNYTKSSEYGKRAIDLMKKSNALKKKVSDIESGKLKAGKDFITRFKFTTYGIPTVTPVFYKVEYQVITERQKDKK